MGRGGIYYLGSQCKIRCSFISTNLKKVIVILDYDFRFFEGEIVVGRGNGFLVRPLPPLYKTLYMIDGSSESTRETLYTT